MATNPKYPQFPEHNPQEKLRPVDDHAKIQTVKKGKFPWPLVAILVAVVILIVLIIWLPSMPQRNPAPAAAQVPQQPTAAQVQLTSLKMAPAPVGAALYISGILHNQGTTAITGAQVRADFLGDHGQVLISETKPLEQITGDASDHVENFANAPVQPNQSRPFRIYFDNFPQNWNHQVPQLTITTVTGTTPS